MMSDHDAIRRGVLALMIGGFVGVAFSGCGKADDGSFGGGLPDYRYRLTVEVETPEGLKTGSSVIEVKTAVAGRNSIPVPGAVSHRLRGEAVTVDLGARGVLFALLRSDDNSDWSTNVFYRLAPKVPRARDAEGRFDSDRDYEVQFKAMLEYREPIELPRTFPEQGHLKDQPALPMLVSFGDLNDPTTVERVDPDDLVTDFGQGVRLRRITIQLTDDPVTTGIVDRLPWLLNQRGSLIPIPRDTPKHEMPIGSDLNEGDFIREQ